MKKRLPGRPTIPDKDKQVRVSLSLPPSTAADFRESAKRSRMSLSAYFVHIWAKVD